LIRPYRADGAAQLHFPAAEPPRRVARTALFQGVCESNAELGHRQNRSARRRLSVVYVPVQFLERAEDFCCICPGDWRYLCPNGPEGGLKGWSGFIARPASSGGRAFQCARQSARGSRGGDRKIVRSPPVPPALVGHESGVPSPMPHLAVRQQAASQPLD
jgi:hypothetical protein